MFRVILAIIVLAGPLLASAQQPKDTIPPRPTLLVDERSGKVKEVTPIDSAKKVDTIKKHSPRKAALRSAIIPGWGQAYNKKYWKIPIVWAAVGIPAYLVYYNQEWYRRTSYAVKISDLGVSKQNPFTNTTVMTFPPFALDKVDPELLPLVKAGQTASLINYRNDFRKNRDYAILFGLILWGLNVVDATVDAHLKDFDVSNDLTLSIKPAVLPGTVAGLSLVLSIGNNRPKNISSLR